MADPSNPKPDDDDPSTAAQAPPRDTGHAPPSLDEGEAASSDDGSYTSETD